MPELSVSQEQSLAHAGGGSPHKLTRSSREQNPPQPAAKSSTRDGTRRFFPRGTRKHRTEEHILTTQAFRHTNINLELNSSSISTRCQSSDCLRAKTYPSGEPYGFRRNLLSSADVVLLPGEHGVSPASGAKGVSKGRRGGVRGVLKT